MSVNTRSKSRSLEESRHTIVLSAEQPNLQVIKETGESNPNSSACSSVQRDLLNILNLLVSLYPIGETQVSPKKHATKVRPAKTSLYPTHHAVQRPRDPHPHNKPQQNRPSNPHPNSPVELPAKAEVSHRQQH